MNNTNWPFTLRLMLGFCAWLVATPALSVTADLSYVFYQEGFSEALR